ncbi:hypothetical protein CAMGR0001_0084 [Campylobacter gracilis RM3268]|uniref:Uncharacterized protein n=1 Tax=Campylobacter gracilis RM3268 TaxID=553220 RepID=C8PIA3_9BACT|nr:hypothetical protein CAMGR0001_0084 [Campylobacter gracilis RM3268]
MLKTPSRGLLCTQQTYYIARRILKFKTAAMKFQSYER